MLPTVSQGCRCPKSGRPGCRACSRVDVGRAACIGWDVMHALTRPGRWLVWLSAVLVEVVAFGPFQ
jgi:hypothetical protein